MDGNVELETNIVTYAFIINMGKTMNG